MKLIDYKSFEGSIMDSLSVLRHTLNDIYNIRTGEILLLMFNYEVASMADWSYIFWNIGPR